MQKRIIYMILITIVAGFQANAANNPTKTERAIDPANMDLSYRPGDNFFRYVNGNWLDNNPIPDEYSSYGATTVIFENNQLQLKSIIDEASQSTEATPGSIKQKIRDFYNSGMDVEKINKLGISTLKADFELVDAIWTKSELAAVTGQLHRQGIHPCFYLYAGADMKNAGIVIANIYQAGLGLPERDYYLDTDERSLEIRQEYEQHIAQMLELSQETAGEAKLMAKNILALETDMAGHMLSRVESRDPNRTYNKMSLETLQQMSPNFDWESYFTAIGYTNPSDLNVRMTEHVKGLNQLIETHELDSWKAYLKWHVLSNSASYLSEEIVQKNFDFFGTFLSGSLTMQPRWKRVLNRTSSALGEGIGQLYVEKYFPPEAKARMEKLVANLRISLQNRINQLDWMSAVTKEKAQEKLVGMNLKVGYPDQWIDYSPLQVSADSYFENVRAAIAFDFDRDIAKIGKAVDKGEWHMTPQTVNAYYSPTMNEIVFPAGILQPPFFNLNADDPVNYGAIGVVIGHEMTHGFDDQGRKYDKDGNLNNWWLDTDSELFDEKTKQLVVLYDSFEVLESKTVNGKLTLGENIADLGGLHIAWDAMNLAAEEQKQETIDGFTPEQRFFMAYAQIWRSNIREKSLLRNLQEDVHSPALARVNRPVFNMDQFYEAFAISPENKLYIPAEERARIW
jgi:putative endopeptidase